MTNSVSQTESTIQPNDVFIGYLYGIDFYDGNGEIVQTAEFESESAFNAEFDDPAWPDEAIRLDSWKRPLYRAPIVGIDYGKGSVRRRFAGYVPRSAYQRRGF